MPKHQPVRSERVIDVETLDRRHAEQQRLTRQPVTPAEADHLDYLRRPSPPPKPL